MKIYVVASNHGGSTAISAAYTSKEKYEKYLRLQYSSRLEMYVKNRCVIGLAELEWFGIYGNNTNLYDVMQELNSKMTRDRTAKSKDKIYGMDLAHMIPEEKEIFLNHCGKTNNFIKEVEVVDG